MYDHLQAIWVRDYVAGDELRITRNGDAGSRNIAVVNGTGEAVVTATDLTLYASSLTGVTLTTTGSITVADGIDITGSTFSSLNLTSGRNLDSVTVTGALTFNDNTAATYDMTDSAIGVLANDGTGLLTFEQTGSTVTDFTDAEVDVVAAPTPADITLTATNASWAIYSDAGTRVASGTGDTTYSNADTDSGVWTVVVNREGYVAEIFTWTGDAGLSFDFAYGAVELLRPEGGNIYSGGATTGLTVSVNGDNYVEVNIPNSLQNAQVVIDAQQDFLSTNDGLDWIYATGITGAPLFGTLNGVTYLLNITGFQYDSIAGVTPESAIGAVLVSSATHANVRTDNGGVSLVSATEAPTAQEIYDLFMVNSLGDMYVRMGLDPANPFTDTPELFSSADGSIEIDVTGDGVTTTTQTRRP